MPVSHPSKPLVSVIIPNFNNAKYIAECIDSVLKQTYENLEIICIDDASSDQSVAIIQEYMQRHKNIFLIENKENIGVSANRHKAIVASKGEFFTTLDSDDFLISEDKIYLELLQILSFASDGDIIAFSDIRHMDERGKELHSDKVNDIREGDIFDDILLRQCLIPRDYLLSKKQYFEVGGFDLNIPLYEDWDLKIRLAKRNRFIYTGVSGIGYRRHGDGLSAASKCEHVKWLRYIFDKNDHLIPKEDLVEYTSAFTNVLIRSFGQQSVSQLLSGSTLKQLMKKVRTMF